MGRTTPWSGLFRCVWLLKPQPPFQTLEMNLEWGGMGWGVRELRMVWDGVSGVVFLHLPNVFTLKTPLSASHKASAVLIGL